MVRVLNFFIGQALAFNIKVWCQNFIVIMYNQTNFKTYPLSDFPSNKYIDIMRQP